MWAAAKEVIVAEAAAEDGGFTVNSDARYDAGMICGGTLEIFVEPMLPQPMLYIFGGGHVSTAVAPMAHQAGFKIVIVDDRESVAGMPSGFRWRARFYTSYEEGIKKFEPKSSSYLLIVTRGHSGRHAGAGLGGGAEARGFVRVTSGRWAASAK